MSLVKSLSAGVAIVALLAAAPASALQLPQRPNVLSLLVHVVATTAEAEAALNDALAKLEAAKAEGTDTTPFDAIVEQARADLAAAQQAEAAAATAAADAAAAKAAEDAAAAKAAEDAAAAAKAAEDAAAAKAAEDAATAAKAAEDGAAAAKAAEDGAAAKAAEDAAAAAKAAEDGAAAKAAEDAAAAKAAEDAAAAKAAEDGAAAAKAAEDAAAAKAAEDGAAAAKAAGDGAAAKAAEDAAAAAKAAEDAAAKAAEDGAAAKAAEDTAAAAKAAEDAAAAAKAAADTAAAPAPPPVMEPLPQAKMDEAAPVLDSAKEALPPAPPPQDGVALPPPPPTAPDAASVAPPVDDSAARSTIVPVVIEPAKQEIGQIVVAPPPPPLPPEEKILKTLGNRLIITINGLNIVEAPEQPRLVRQDDEVIIERLSRGRTRETIVRQNGVQVVTIKNRWGDIIQRSRILPDGREVILAYTPEYDREEYVQWRDPVYDLPPLILRIPVREYTLNASLIEDEDEYYDFLDKPPVERVERIYSVQDVKRSARVRDKARRVEMGNITFGFGTADIDEDQIDKLQGMADAMLKLIKKNPAETFLIEGHTDAVGSDIANLALSDKRAESVAIALNNVFDVPSENLTTQGYGERYLKVKTLLKEPLNRRVVFRRITPLITPVASAE